MSLRFDHSTLAQRVLFGAGRVLEHGAAAVADLSARRVLVVADDFARDLVDQLAERMPVVGRIHDIVQHVPAERARQAVDLARELDADAVVAVGGGSATGLAKIVGRDTGIPIVAIPTTFAGSEATDVWGITEHERKVTGSDPRVLPRVVVYDAELSATLPADLAIASGLNAVAHAVDSLWAPRADPINAALGMEGLSALVRGLRQVRTDPGEVDARERVLYGAYLAAVAFASAGSGMHHKICHVLGGTFGLPHAPTHAVVLPYVAAVTLPAAPVAAERLREALGVADPAAALAELREELGAPASLGALGFDLGDIPVAAELAAAAIPASHPGGASVDVVADLLRAATAGEPPARRQGS